MRVLHFYSHYHPDTFGGGEQLINQICRGTSTLGVENTVLTLSPTAAPPLVRVDGHEVHRCRIDFTIASNRFSLAIVGRLRALAAQVDLVHCYYPWPWGDLACLLAGVRKPLVVSQLSDIVKQRVLQFVHRPVEALLLRRAGAIVATSPNYVRGSAVLARHPDKVQVIPVGLDDRDYPPADPALREQWRARVGERFFLFVGVLRYYKGLEYLLEALAGTNIRVVLVGTGPREAFLKQRARELRLDNLSFLGRVSEADKRALLELCHGFVFPSHLRSESFGVSLLEAARYGKPMICCEIGTGTSFVNIDGDTGLVVPPADPAALRQAMQRLDTDAALAARFGAGARRRFLEVFQMQAMAEAYLATYRRLTAQ